MAPAHRGWVELGKGEKTRKTGDAKQIRRTICGKGGKWFRSLCRLSNKRGDVPQSTTLFQWSGQYGTRKR